MDFTRELSGFQGVIISADNVHSFSRITARGGNEEKIQYIIHKMQTFLLEENIVDSNGIIPDAIQKMRKFAMYVVLNSDLSVLEKMVETEEFGLVIWSVPTIPKYLMCEILWNLNMESFVYEIMAFAYPTLALDVARAFLDHFKYFTPIECPNKLKNLSTSCYTIICRLHHIHLGEDKLADILTAAYNVLQKFLTFYSSPPNEFKLNQLKKDDLYKYKGKCLNTLLEMLYNCLELYQTRDKNSTIQDLYALTLKPEASKDNENVSVKNDAICECLNNCNIMIMDKCKELVMDVSVDIFCAWNEFEENGVNMQQSIGEFCHTLRTKLLSVPTVAEHQLVGMIQQISRKPIDMKELINTIDIKTIIANINENDSRSLEWLYALIYKDELCDNLDLLQILTANIDIFNEEQSYQLYKIFKLHTDHNMPNKEVTKLLAVKAFQRCNINIQHQILEEHFSNSCFHNKMETPELHNMMTQIFNKLIVSLDADITDVLTVFLQNPQQTYLKIFAMAAENAQQLDIMTKVMRLLQNYCNNYYSLETEPCIVKITQIILERHLDTESKQYNFVKFIANLKAENILPASKLLMFIIMPNIHKALLCKDVKTLFMQVKLLREVYTLEELLVYRAPMLAMLGQVLDVVRWRINTFKVIGPQALQFILHLQQSLMATYNSVIPETEAKWLRSKLHKIQPSNMYYYRLLWNPPGNNFLEIISGAKVTKNTDPNQITMWLSQIICSCTQQEWCDIWNSLLVFDDTMILKVLYDTLSIVTQAEESHRSESTWACLLYCYRNIIFVIRYKFFKEPMTDRQVTTAVNIVTSIANQIRGPKAKEFIPILLPLISYLVEKKDDYTINATEVLSGTLRNTDLEDLVNKVLVNGSN